MRIFRIDAHRSKFPDRTARLPNNTPAKLPWAARRIGYRSRVEHFPDLPRAPRWFRLQWGPGLGCWSLSSGSGGLVCYWFLVYRCYIWCCYFRSTIPQGGAGQAEKSKKIENWPGGAQCGPSETISPARLPGALLAIADIATISFVIACARFFGQCPSFRAFSYGAMRRWCRLSFLALFACVLHIRRLDIGVG